jgi:hypothetical protein
MIDETVNLYFFNRINYNIHLRDFFVFLKLSCSVLSYCPIEIEFVLRFFLEYFEFLKL